MNQLDNIYSITTDELYVWVAENDTGKIGIIPKNYTYDDIPKQLTVVTKGVLKKPRSLVYDPINNLIFILETSKDNNENGKI